MYILYSLLLACVAILSLPWWAIAASASAEISCRLQRAYGAGAGAPKTRARMGCIWMHAVSVGEVLAISHLAAELKKGISAASAFCFHHHVYRTATCAPAFWRRSVSSICRWTFGFALRPYYDFLRPDLLVLAETEFWPNLLHLVHDSGAKVAIVNARISDRSFPRYQRFRAFFSRVLSNVDLFLPADRRDAARLTALEPALTRCMSAAT